MISLNPEYHLFTYLFIYLFIFVKLEVVHTAGNMQQKMVVGKPEIEAWAYHS